MAREERDASATESVPLEYKRFDASRATRGVCECLMARASFGESFCVFFVAAGRLAASESESCCTLRLRNTPTHTSGDFPRLTHGSLKPRASTP